MPQPTTKPWPTDGRLPDFADDLCDPLAAAIRAAFALERVHPDRDIPYDGMELPDWAGPADVNERLSVDGLQTENDIHGGDALDVLVRVAVQTGIAFGEARLRAARRHGGCDARDGWDIETAVSEACHERGVDDPYLPTRVTQLLAGDLAALREGNMRRVRADLDAETARLQRLRVEDPAEYERLRAAQAELAQRVLADLNTP